MKEKFFLPHFHLLLAEKKGCPFELKIIVTRKIKKAVERNRIKRVVREFFRMKRGLLRWQGVILKIQPTAAGVKNGQLFQELNQIL